MITVRLASRSYTDKRTIKTVIIIIWCCQLTAGELAKVTASQLQWFGATKCNGCEALCDNSSEEPRFSRNFNFIATSSLISSPLLLVVVVEPSPGLGSPGPATRREADLFTVLRGPAEGEVFGDGEPESGEGM